MTSCLEADLCVIGAGAAGLSVAAGASQMGADTVLIDNTTIYVWVYINVGYGADRLTIRNVDPLTQWPSLLLGFVTVDLGPGVDTLINPAGVGFNLFNDL